MSDPQFDAPAEPDDLDLAEPLDPLEDPAGLDAVDASDMAGGTIEDLGDEFSGVEPLIDDIPDPLIEPPVDPAPPELTPPEPPPIDLDVTPPATPEPPAPPEPVIYEHGTTVSQVPLADDTVTVEEITASPAYQEWEASVAGAATDGTGGLEPTETATGTMVGDSGDDNFWFRQTEENSCGPASATQIVNDFLGTEHANDKALAARAFELQQPDPRNPGRTIPLYDPSEGMTPGALAMLLDDQGVPSSVAMDQTFTDVEQYLREGRAVVMFLDATDVVPTGYEAFAATDEVEDSAQDKVDHFVRVIGIDQARGVAILANPGHDGGAHIEIPLEALEEAWDDVTHGDGSRRHMLVVSDVADPTPDDPGSSDTHAHAKPDADARSRGRAPRARPHPRADTRARWWPDPRARPGAGTRTRPGVGPHTVAQRRPGRQASRRPAGSPVTRRARAAAWSREPPGSGRRPPGRAGAGARRAVEGRPALRRTWRRRRPVRAVAGVGPDPRDLRRRTGVSRPPAPMSDVLSLGPSATVTFERAPITQGPERPPIATGTYPLRWAPGPSGHEVVALPVGPDEAVWLSLRAEEPTALQLLVDGRNALTGTTPSPGLERDPQDYVVVPDQRWLDGVQVASGTAEQLRGPRDASTDIELRLVARRLRSRAFFEWWRGSGAERRANHFGDPEPVRGGGEVGHVRQAAVPDPFAEEDWDPDPVADVGVRLAHPTRWSALTGEPTTP